MPNFSSGKWDYNTGKVGGSYSIWTTRDGEDMPVKIANLINNSPRLSKEEREANARLIAAAPELYHTLKDCFSLIEQLWDWDGIDDNEAENLLIRISGVLNSVDNPEIETQKKETTNDE